jgi:hypothetical protein
MLQRGAGAVLFTLGASALGPSVQLAQLGAPLAGLRNYLLSVAQAAAPLGVRIGILTIGGLVLGSDIHRTWAPNAGPETPGALDPDELAVVYGDLLSGGDTERIVGPFAPRPS